jgi:photosystem II stability/assembly factor-like uncharacterized protein
MKTTLLKISFIFPLMILVGAGCKDYENYSQTKWQSIDIGYTGDLNDISLPGGDTIMLLSELDGSYQQTCIFESDDAGKTWKKWCFKKLEFEGFSSFYCFNSKKIYATGEALFQSNGNGYSWLKSGDTGGLLYFFNRNEGLRISGFSIYKTTDGGRSFELKYDSISYGGCYFLQFPDRNVGYTSGSSGIYINSKGIVLKTTDGGNSWHSSPGKFSSITGMSFKTADIGYIISSPLIAIDFDGTGGSSKATLLLTTDGGDTWTTINDSLPQIPIQCYFTDKQHGFICGSKIFSTKDGGKNWQEEYERPSSGYALNKMAFTSSGTGYAIGNNGLFLKRTH